MNTLESQNRPKGPFYDYTHAEILCNQTGLKFDTRIINLADPVFIHSKLSQPQVNDMLRLHVTITAWLWDRRSYSRWQRLVLALYFLGLGKRIKSASNDTGRH